MLCLPILGLDRELGVLLVASQNLMSLHVQEASWELSHENLRKPALKVGFGLEQSQRADPIVLGYLVASMRYASFLYNVFYIRVVYWGAEECGMISMRADRLAAS